MNNNITNINQKLLTQLSSFPLSVANGRIDQRDFSVLLQHYIQLLQFQGSYAETHIDLTTSGSQKLISWTGNGNNINEPILTRIKIKTGNAVPGGLNSSGWYYIFDIAVPVLGKAAITIQAGVGDGYTGALSFIPTFRLNSYSVGGTENEYEFGFDYVGSSVCDPNFRIDTYVESISEFDTIFPVMNLTNSTPFTSSPVLSVPISTNNGTNWYCWATTSYNSGGTTNGFV